MTRVALTESTWTAVPELGDNEAAALRRLGRELASKTRWWGERRSDDPVDDPDDEMARTVIRCRSDGKHWLVRADACIGAFGVGDRHFFVQPKIGIAHASFILSRAEYVPRIREQNVLIAAGDGWLEMLVRSLLGAARRLLRGGLLRDYVAAEEETDVVRGAIVPGETARRYYEGALTFACAFDDFRVDTELNRFISGAVEVAGTMAVLPAQLRRDARQLAASFPTASNDRSREFRRRLRPREADYEPAVGLTKILLAHRSLDITAGGFAVWSFLIRTPEAIEAGIRGLLASELGPAIRVFKNRIALDPSSMSASPDLRFQPGNVVGDVKYRCVGDDWARADLYQAVAFASAAAATDALVIAFRPREGTEPPTVRFGKIRVQRISWCTSEDRSPADEGRRFVAAVRDALRDHSAALDATRPGTRNRGRSDEPACVTAIGA